MSRGRTTSSAVLTSITEMRRGIEKRTVTEMIGDKLESLIASGVLQAGDELPGERELASALSVSRQTIRNAVQGLAARGIVDVSQGSRTRVAGADLGLLKIGAMTARTINSYDLEAVHEARLLIECAVVRDAAVSMDAETLAQLRHSLEVQRATLDDPVRFLICDREFHVAIYRASRNPLLADVVTDLYAYMMDNRRRAMGEAGAIQRSYEDHVAIVEAFAAGDADAVVAAFEQHLARIYETTRQQLAVGASSEVFPPLRGRGRSPTAA